MERKGFQLGKVLTISFAHISHDIYASFLSPVTYILIDKFALSNLAIGFLSVCQRLPMLANPFLGIISERVKSRYFVILTPAITAIVMSLMGVAPWFGIIALLVFVSGASSAFFHVPSPVMIKKVSADRIGMGMSFYMTAGNLARMIGPLVFVATVKMWGFENTWYLIPFGVAVSVFLYFTLKDVEIRTRFHKEEQKNNNHYWQTFKKFLPLFTTLIGITFFSGFMKTALSFYLPLYLKEQGAGLWFSSGFSLAVLYGSSALGTLLSGTLSDMLGRRNVILSALMLSPFLLYLFTFVKGFWVLPFLVLLGLVLFSPMPVLMAIIHEQKSDSLPFLNGVFMTINFVVNSLVTLLIGFGSDFLGFRYAYQIAAGIGFIAILFGFRISKTI
ncbi:MAG: MFS transporter [Bacteroidales bacterium]|nr:MFS transporter [Bacteroidales bacterium]